jgi:hypothetical protein
MTVYSYSFQNSITSLFIAILTGDGGSIFEKCTPNSQSLMSVFKRMFVIIYIVVVVLATILVMNLMVSVDFCLHIMYC